MIIYKIRNKTTGKFISQTGYSENDNGYSWTKLTVVKRAFDAKSMNEYYIEKEHNDVEETDFEIVAFEINEVTTFQIPAHLNYHNDNELPDNMKKEIKAWKKIQDSPKAKNKMKTARMRMINS